MKLLDTTIPFEELPFHLNLASNQTVFISSDLKNFARIAKKQQKSLDLDLFITNLQHVLIDGTIIIPAYTDQLKQAETFDYHKSKPTTGALSNRVFKRKDFIRTADPLHSVFVWGNHQASIIALDDESTFGQHTVFGFMHRVNGLFLFLDVHIENSFTFIHYIEEYLNVPYRKYYPLQVNVIKDGVTSSKTVQFHTKKAGVVTDFADLNSTMIAKQLLLQYYYEQVEIKLITASDTVKLVEEKIKQKKYLYHFSVKVFVINLLKSITYFLKSYALLGGFLKKNGL